MTRLLSRLLGRLPLGWLQLTHSPARMAAALAGVAFANALVFLQLGILGALNGSITTSYAPFRADILISSSDANTLTDGAPLARRLLWQALAEPDVASAVPLYLAKADWTRPDGSTASLTVYGLPVEGARFAGPVLAGQLPGLALADTALVDRMTRGADPELLSRIAPDAPLVFEMNGRRLTASGTVALGASFTGDGALIVSDQTFLRLFPQRAAGTPSLILIDLAPGAVPREVAARIAAQLANEPVKVRSLHDAIAADIAYQTTQRPVGLVFGFGVFIGLLVGIVIVYQVLSTDVADHLREYATFKAMGYPHRFFLGVVLEEAVILGSLGFLPGFAFALTSYHFIASKANLPIHMTPERAVAVFLGTVLACALSGALATRRLQRADPAELF
jgi:putative ABC transport system permease protein